VGDAEFSPRYDPPGVFLRLDNPPMCTGFDQTHAFFCGKNWSQRAGETAIRRSHVIPGSRMVTRARFVSPSLRVLFLGLVLVTISVVKEFSV
jgi:hypothetical protein